MPPPPNDSFLRVINKPEKKTKTKKTLAAMASAFSLSEAKLVKEVEAQTQIPQRLTYVNA